MLSNLLRTQARLAVTARVPLAFSRVFAASPALLARAAPFSTSHAVRYQRESEDFGGFNGGSGGGRPTRAPRPPNSPSATLFIGSLPYSADKAELAALLSDYQGVVDVRIGQSLTLNQCDTCR